ncbi:hypothetical protein AArcSl_0453 [Halalkaliarchaeum desulfuricum]|uniref:Lipoprotein n=1 Tax=Halalkaliarchaeum desulfuricum TaxID=2055893 RepID=A0A343TG84_9EURY|nr:hypothetical protein [Halalkaliarchaeum desulfuricum]AUX08106.1 hypothetical protein AArcSl_0453 [Halalkaliarchaeum desulfuricum]
MNRRTILASLVASMSGVGLAGCLDSPSVTSNDLDGTTTSTPETISKDEAKKRAYEAEEEFVIEIVKNAECVTSDVGTGYPYTEFTSIDDRTEEGVYVAVELPYWYKTGIAHVHTKTQATYFVTDDTVERVDGDEVTIKC